MFVGNITIIDNDVHWSEMKSAAQLELEGENAPVIAAVRDDRKEEIRRQQDGWKKFGEKSPDRKKIFIKDESPKRRKLKNKLKEIAKSKKPENLNGEEKRENSERSRDLVTYKNRFI